MSAPDTLRAKIDAPRTRLAGSARRGGKPEVRQEKAGSHTELAQIVRATNTKKKPGVEYKRALEQVYEVGCQSGVGQQCSRESAGPDLQ